MIVNQLIKPNSIVVVGASENSAKPGGKVLRNLIDHRFNGKVYGINPGELTIQGMIHLKSAAELSSADLAILAIPAALCIETVRELLTKDVKAFILFSAGFSEVGEDGAALEQELVQIIRNAGATLIGPNCIGVIQESYKGVFTCPIPDYHPNGCELISSSGATAVFILEAAAFTGLRFSNVYSIGNGAQIGVEEILEYMDESYTEESPKVKLLYLEEIRNPFKFIRHATSLVKKGCHLAAIKSGHSEAGSRAALSHTGAMATSDAVVRALFRKCGIVYCSGREELISVGGIFQTGVMSGERLAIITHAGGSAVMLTDALASGGLSVPHIGKERAGKLLEQLHPGSSVENPIDFLATGTAVQLGEIIDFCESSDVIDAMIVVFGSPGLMNVREVYDVLLQKMAECSKPIYPVLPSVVNAAKEIRHFLSKGKINFPDEVVLGHAISQVAVTHGSRFNHTRLPEMDYVQIRSVINAAPVGLLDPKLSEELMFAAGIDVVPQKSCTTETELLRALTVIGFPLVMKVNGPVHKTEVNGVRLNIQSEDHAKQVFQELMVLPEARGVLLQEMIRGEELYCGAVHQGEFGHLVMCGAGGILLELLGDTASGLAPLSRQEASEMIRSLKAYPLFKGYRNRPALDEDAFRDIVCRVAALVHICPEISELDINPVIALGKKMYAVDVRIKL